MKHIIGNQTFSKFGLATKKAKEIRAKGIRILKGEEYNFMFDFIDYHPSHEELKGNGVKSIEVIRSSIGFDNCFAVVDKDLNVRQFSYKKCVARTKVNKEASKHYHIKNKRLDAYRQAIQEQIDTAYYVQLMNGNRQCACCGVTDDLQVDHIKPLVKIVNLFEQTFKPCKYPELITITNNSLYSVRFEDESDYGKSFVMAWESFHRQHSTYQILCGKCNLSKGGKGMRYKSYINNQNAN